MRRQRVRAWLKHFWWLLTESLPILLLEAWLVYSAFSALLAFADDEPLPKILGPLAWFVTVGFGLWCECRTRNRTQKFITAASEKLMTDAQIEFLKKHDL